MPRTAAYIREIFRTYAFDYNAGGNLIYAGYADMGSLKSDAKWAIRKLTYDGSGNAIDIQWADGNNNMDNVWDNRATLPYS